MPTTETDRRATSSRWARTRFRASRTAQQTMIRLAARLATRNPLARRAALRMGRRMVMACAYGGDLDLLDRRHHPTTILVRGPAGVERFELFECDAPGDTHRHCFDKRTYRPLPNTEATPIFGAGIHRIATANTSQDRHYFVRAHLQNGSRDSDIMHAKITSHPTRHAAGALRVESGPTPSLHWPQPLDHSHWVSFLLVREQRPITDPTLLTAVYSWAQHWSLPDLRHAPFYYHNPDPTPTLIPDHAYEAWWFDVDRDGWISQMDRAQFPAGQPLDPALAEPEDHSH